MFFFFESAEQEVIKGNSRTGAGNNKGKFDFTYDEGDEYMRGKYDKLPASTPIHSKSFRVNDSIIIKYPGKNPKKYGDYVVEYKHDKIPHSGVCQIIYDMVKNEEISKSEMKKILEDIFYFGLSKSDNNAPKKIKELKELIFWVTLQEHMFYKEKLGRLLSFYRYAEALMATEEYAERDIEEVKARADYRASYALRLLNNSCLIDYYN